MTLEHNIFEACKMPSQEEEVEDVCFIEALVEEQFDLEYEQAINFIDSLCDEIDTPSSSLFQEQKEHDAGAIALWTPRFEELPTLEQPQMPSCVEHPQLELKPLPEFLKYAYLGKIALSPWW